MDIKELLERIRTAKEALDTAVARGNVLALTNAASSKPAAKSGAKKK